tara:strand:+ start:234 stop:515 length:282 start_codon:yes stop_codon:yes gene_type:complete
VALAQILPHLVLHQLAAVVARAVRAVLRLLVVQAAVVRVIVEVAARLVLLDKVLLVVRVDQAAGLAAAAVRLLLEPVLQVVLVVLVVQAHLAA